MNKKLSLLALGLITLSGVVSANDNYNYICTLGKVERQVKVVYFTSKFNIPCEVQYAKSGKTETLWSANYTENFCEEKASNLVKTLEDTGWSCSLNQKNTTTEAKQ